jgi:hypothetical protein
MDVNGEMGAENGYSLEDELNYNEYVEIETDYVPEYPFTITSSLFDDSQELFWTGTNDVTIQT